ncbi:ABC transporter transmembrane domain-containing protein [Chromobacterium vaccinii]|uniref:ABC transporter transmembrane domain-containing protein n=1 Tax=Chromobacterium vaccinii TaxID=1108595 RepID=UPI001C93112D|nr:ABC transporter transmembrane domain-containing protein [Chromobacterium vaccinii]
MSLISLAAVIIYVSLRYSNFHSLRKATAEQILHTAKQNTHFIESIRGVQSIRLFNRQEERRIGWMNTLADQFNADIKIAKLSISFQTANYLLFNCERIIVIWLASLSVMDNKFSVGMLFAF